MLRLGGSEDVTAAFATSQFVRSTMVAGVLVRKPLGEVHAKVMGTTRTLCGQSSLSWVKLWGMAFSTVVGNRCPVCVRRMGDAQRASAGPR